MSQCVNSSVMAAGPPRSQLCSKVQVLRPGHRLGPQESYALGVFHNFTMNLDFGKSLESYQKLYRRLMRTNKRPCAL